MPSTPVVTEALRLYILGAVRASSPEHALAILAEHRGARATHHLQLGQLEVDAIQNAVHGIRGFIETGTPDLNRRDVQALGELLADVVLRGEVRSLFDGAVATGTMMPLELLIEDAVLAMWPWEYLYDRVTKGFVCENFQPVCRGVFSATRDVAANRTSPTLRILVAVGGDESGGILPKHEVQWITDVLEAWLDKHATLKTIRVVQGRDLQDELAREDYDVVHYYGHGDFDAGRGEAYLALQQRSGGVWPIYAEDFATLIMDRGIRLVFLNACKTAVGSATAGLIRSSMAPALVNKGVPAVIATQFVLPDGSAHYLSSMIYHSLAAGARLVDAVRAGRQAMKDEPKTGFVDWGIPVLYTRDAACVLRPAAAPAKAATGSAHHHGNGPGPETPIVVPRTSDVDSRAAARCRVALVDLDSKVGFLPDLVTKVNAAQTYYHLEVAYLPMPSGAVRTRGSDEPQTYLPQIQELLVNASKKLGVDVTCYLTEHYLSGEDFGNYLAVTLGDSKTVVVSTGSLPTLAEEASVSFAKAVLCLCFSQIILAEERWPKLDRHPKTVGCLFDFCEKHGDIIKGLKKMKFDHSACRKKIADPDQLSAIDAIVATDILE